jgi:hypothetical protein
MRQNLPLNPNNYNWFFANQFCFSYSQKIPAAQMPRNKPEIYNPRTSRHYSNSLRFA